MTVVVKLKGLKSISKGGVFTRYKKGVADFGRLTKKVSEEVKATIVKSNETVPAPNEIQTLMQVIRQRDGNKSRVIIPAQIRYDDFVQAQKKEKEMYVLQAKAIAVNNRYIKEALATYDRYRYQHPKVRVKHAIKFINKKQELKKVLSGYLTYLIGKFRNFSIHENKDAYITKGFDNGDYEYIPKKIVSYE